MGGRGRDRAAAKSKVAWLAAAHAATRRSRGPAAAQSKARLPARSCCQLGPERGRAPHGGQSEAADRGASGACPTSPICPTSVPLPLPHLGATQVQLKRTSDKRGWPSHHLAVLVRRLRPSEGTFDAVPPVDEDNVAPWKRDRLVETATRPWHCLSSAPAQGALGGSGWLGALRGRGRPTGRPATALAARATAASKVAESAAFGHAGGLVIDYPTSECSKKMFLVLVAKPRPPKPQRDAKGKGAKGGKGGKGGKGKDSGKGAGKGKDGGKGGKGGKGKGGGGKGK